MARKQHKFRFVITMQAWDEKAQEWLDFEVDYILTPSISIPTARLTYQDVKEQVAWLAATEDM